jgi:hypothetical protein
MLGARAWLALVLGQLALLMALNPVYAALESRAAAAGQPLAPPVVIAVRVVGVLALVGFVVCLPPLVLRLFVAGQVRIGNGGHPMVAFVARHQAHLVGTVLGVWLLGLLTALPFALRDLRAERAAGDAGDADARRALAEAGVVVPADDSWMVMPARPGTPPHDNILAAVRERLGTTNDFRTDHVMLSTPWAFARGPEVVTVDGEAQETDLTFMALLEVAPDHRHGEWRVVELWSLPGEAAHPLAEFRRRVRARQRTARLPASLFPADF